MTDGHIDIATALDTTLRHPTIEAKYQKLRLFSADKIKSLLGTVDIQVKKLKEFRGASDGRTATIKALQSKLRDQEFIADVLKEDLLNMRNKAEELSDNSPMSIKELNQEVINKTIGGPKRFRQLSREEIENNLMELEILEKQYRATPVVEKKITSRRQTLAGKSKQSMRPGAVDRGRTDRTDRADVMGTDMTLGGESPDHRMQQLQQQQRDDELHAQEENIQQLVDDMERIRATNANQKVKKENSVLISKDYEELTISMNRIDVTLKDVNERLRESKRDLSNMKNKQLTETDTLVANIERAKKECSDAFAENNALLSKMLEIEQELDQAMSGKLYGSNSAKITDQSDSELDALEIKLTKQLKDCRTRKRSLEERVATTSDLREHLRAKNEEYRVLKRDMSEVAKTKLVNSPSKSSGVHK